MENKPTSDEIAYNLYKMKLAQVYRAFNWTYIRVPGGWIWTLDGGESVFIPLDNEFQK